MIFKQLPTIISDVSKVGETVNKLKAINFPAVGLNTGNIEVYRNAIAGISKEQASLLLSTKGLNQAQIELILSNEKVTASEIAEAAALSNVTKSKSILTVEQQKQLITSKALTSEKLAEISATLGLEAAEDGSLISKKVLNAEMVKQQLKSIGVVGSTQSQIMAMLGLTTAETSATTATNVLSGAMTNLSLAISSNPIGALITGISIAIASVYGLTKAYDALTISAKEVKERTDSLMESYNSAISEANSNANTIESIASKYETLSKGVNDLGENVSLTTDEYAEYNDIVNQISEMFPTMITGYTDEGNAILSLKGNVNELRDAYKEAQKEAYNMLIISGEDSDGNDIIKQWENINNTGFLSNLFDLGADDIDGSISVSDAIEQLKAIQQMTAEEYREIERIITEGSKKDIAELTDIQKDIGYGSYLHKALGLDSNVTDKEYIQIQKQANALVQTYNAEIESALSDVKTLANAFLMTNEDYEKLDEQSKTAASLLINSIDENIADGFKHVSDVGEYVGEIVDSIYGDVSVQKALSDLFSMDTDNMSVGEIQSNVDSYVSIIAKAIGEDAKELKIRLGFDDTDIDSSVNRIKTFLKDEFDDKVMELNSNDLDIASKLEIPEGTLLSWDELINKIDEYKKESNSAEVPASLEQLLSTGELSDIKDELYDLSRSGKLDKDTLESTERFAQLLTLTGMEGEEAVDQIEKLAQASDDLGKMSSFVDGLDELSKAYELFQDGEIIDSSTLSSIQNIFGSGTEEFQNFKDAVMSGSGDIQTVFNDLANSYLDTTGALDGLTEANKKHYIEELKNNGIVNANAVVESRLSGVQKQRTAIIDALNSCNSSLNKTNANLVITTNNLEKATWQEIAALIEESGQSKNTAQALAVYALKKALANAEQIHEEESISQIKMLAETAGIASTIVTAYINAKNGNIKDSEAAQKIISEYQEKLNSVESKYKGTKAVVAPVVTSYSPDVGDDDKDDKDSLSEFNQMINWCEQSINKLSNAISLLNAKLDNTTSYKKQSSLLSKLINKQNQLTNAYEKTANVYSEKYSNALSKLSKSDRAKVQNESYSIEQFYAETESGEISTTEKRYNNIKDALEWRDSLAEIREQYVSSTKQMNDYAEQLADIPWDEAESKVEKLNDKIDLLDSKLNNTNGYTKKNKILNQQFSLQKQIVAQYEKALKTENDQLSQYKKSLKTTYSKDGNDILSKINKKYKQKSDYNSDSTLKVDKKASKQQQQLIKEYNTSISKLNAISKNNKLSTTGLTGDVLELALKYNATLEEIRTNTTQLAQEQEELKTQSTENIMTQIENIQSDYDRYSSIRDAQINEINNKMDLAEANGRLLGTSYYTELMRIENEDMKKTIEEKNKLMSKINEIEPYTDEWYEMKLAIYECDDEIRQATISIQEYQNTIDELDWSNFERLQGLLDNLIEESDFLINVLSNKKSTNDNGLTNEGLASLGLHAVDYDTYMSQAEEYKNKINELNKKIEEDPYNTNYINQRNEYLKLQQECIESALSEKQSIIELATDGLTAEQEALEETINKKKELLKTEEDLYSFRKKIKEQTKIIADLEKQINALQGDDSEENRKKLQELKADLADARSDLEDTMHNQSVGDLETDLDDMLNTSKTKLEEYLEDSEQVFIDALTKVNNNTGIIAETIKSTAKEVGYTISNELASSWNTAGQAVTAYNNTFVNVSAGIITSINGIKSAWQDALKAYENYASISVTASQNRQSQYADNGASADDIWDFINDNKDKATHEKSYYLDTNQYIYEKTGGYVLTKANELNLAKLLGMDTTGVTASNISNAFRNSILDKLKNAGFTTGGYIDAIKRTGEDGVALVRHGEAVLTVEQSKQFKKLTENLKPLNEIIKLSSDNIKLPNYTPSSIYEINNNFKIDGIATNEVVDQMGTIVSKEVEKSITKINQQNYAKGVRRKL